MYDNFKSASTDPIGRRIRRLRRSRGWSLAELARRAGTSAPALHRYESGWNRFELKTLRKIASALGMRLDIRLIGKEKKPWKKNRKPAEIVRLLAPLFWDRTIRPSDLRDYPQWILCRTLMYGDMAQVSAVREYYGDQRLKDTLALRAVDSKTRNFWNLLLEGETNASQGTR